MKQVFFFQNEGNVYLSSNYCQNISVSAVKMFNTKNTTVFQVLSIS